MKPLNGFNVLILLLFFFLNGGGLMGETKVVPMPDLEKPDSITMGHEYLYITDQGTIAIYSLKDVKLKNKFGRKGEGPGEFRIRPFDKLGLQVFIHGDYIVVNSTGKLSFFTRSGEFKEEITYPGEMQSFTPLGSKFVGYSRTKENDLLYLTINIYDPRQLQMEKEIYRRRYYGQLKGPSKILRLVMATKNASMRGALYQVYNNRLFLEGENNEILVFDDSGKKLYTVRQSYEKMKIPDPFKQKVMAFLKKRYPTIYRHARQYGEFPGYFPLRYFLVTDSKIYVLTFKTSNGKNELYILDLEGKLLGKTMVPFEEAEFLQPYPFTIGKGVFYQLNENLDTEEWELHIHQIR